MTARSWDAHGGDDVVDHGDACKQRGELIGAKHATCNAPIHSTRAEVGAGRKKGVQLEREAGSA